MDSEDSLKFSALTGANQLVSPALCPLLAKAQAEGRYRSLQVWDTIISMQRIDQTVIAFCVACAAAASAA